MRQELGIVACGGNEQPASQPAQTDGRRILLSTEVDGQAARCNFSREGKLMIFFHVVVSDQLLINMFDCPLSLESVVLFSFPFSHSLSLSLSSPAKTTVP